MEDFGSLVIVLHSEVPCGMEDDPAADPRLFEVAADSWIPLLEMASRLQRSETKPNFAISFTPAVLDRIADRRFARNFKNYLATQARSAEDEFRAHSRRGQTGLARLYRLWRDFRANVLGYFADVIGEDIPGAFRRAADAGSIELIASAATNAYLPLLATDENVRAQIELGVQGYRRHFGQSPRGFWLPGCGYRPAGNWRPPVVHERVAEHERLGIDEFLRDQGIDYVFVDHAQLKMSPPQYEHNSTLRFHRLGWFNDTRRVLGAYASDSPICKLVAGPGPAYPGDSLYLDFYKRSGQANLRLWRVSGANVPPDRKQEYDPAHAFDRVRAHAAHFVGAARDALAWYRDAIAERGVVVAAFDAELFGHRWFEGISWLENVAEAAAREPIRLETPAQCFDTSRPSWHLELRESSSGPNNDHSAWLREESKLTWWNIYEAEAAMQHLGYVLDGREISSLLAQVLRQAMRELLILESSDWPLADSDPWSRGNAERSAHAHFNEFKHLASLVEWIAGGGQLNAEDSQHVGEAIERTAIFPDLDLNLFWRGKFHIAEAQQAVSADSQKPTQTVHRSPEERRID